MEKKEIFSNIRNKELSIEQLSSSIEINDFVDGFRSIPRGKKITYGVNVRLSQDVSNSILPFSYCNDKSFSPQIVASRVDSDFKIPNFMNLFKVKETVFRVRFRRYGPKDVLITQIVNKGVSLNPFATSQNDDSKTSPIEERFKKDFFDKNTKTFLHENLKELKLQSGIAYVWLRGEDPDISEGGQGNYLTNIVAISNDWDLLEKFRKEKLTAILEFVMLLKSRRTDDVDVKQKKEAIKSAISAIMSRNMSHNLGSHYLYYTKADLEALARSQTDIAPQIRGTAKVLGYVQARMDYLATIISNDKYPYGAVNFKSQVYDELTIDDFSRRHFHDKVENRTTNFLLSNLVLSENFSRPNVCGNSNSLPEGIDPLSLHIKYSEDGKEFKVFTGTGMSFMDDDVLAAMDAGENVITKETEQDVKNLLSSLYIALPGGIMSCHALYNVIENFIRNSAKYMREYTSKDEGLLITIAIRPSTKGCDLEKDKYVDIIIYDNKKNANALVSLNDDNDTPYDITLYDSILKKLGTIEIINASNQLSKENKGFKEMLFSAIWMKSFAFGDKSFGDIVADINGSMSVGNKLNLIEKYGFSLVRVVEDNCSVRAYRRNFSYDGESNLGILLRLPLFKTFQRFTPTFNHDDDVTSMLNTMADVVIVNDDLNVNYKRAFTRILYESELKSSKFPKQDDYDTFKLAVKKRFPDIDDYSLCFADIGNQNQLYVQEAAYSKTKDDHKLYFRRHINNDKSEMAKYNKYAYADTISGGNFTVTLLDLFKEGLDDNGFHLSNKDKILALKIKESALTRITIIDERIFKSSVYDGKWLEFKNIRVLDYDEIKEGSSIISNLDDIFKGNSFRDKKNCTHFLSIHLGLIEKILKNSSWVNNEITKRLLPNSHNISGNPLAPERVTVFMKMLYDNFKYEGSNELLQIAIHSGRGNFSAELEGPLAKYPFLSLSALENVFHNSKYLLSQLFYNTVYLGKGYANQKTE